MYFSNSVVEAARLVVTPVFGALVIGYFAYHSLKGDHGLSAYLALTGEITKAEIALRNHRRERLLIERRTELLSPDNLDIDTLDERARAVLNFLEVDDRVILD